ncbi:hypothetical protein R75461_05853 [Paraburkholderia nemoris]|uniref:DUF421 domain-containing protein n=1 Tax=Paraburkholderia nemoris TaxID=2793076 RepID=UPI00190A6BF5|nr:MULTISPECIES: YetF domain-containing protein [Paraburkholderia]MBK3786107.1 DUF421 domain-containing protein [Paraburkholderia aspalathi]CAE6815608.1 hypothetical protein R75461_05853 [Paraburkholderia nemoris]
MNAIAILFGEGKDLDVLQMGMRALVVFMIALALIRVAGRRSFGQRSAFDYVVAILLGATLSRAIVGASPFLATVVASTVIVVLHRLLAWLCMYSRVVERLMVGVEREVFRKGQFNKAEMTKALVTATDIQESVRQTLGERGMSNVEAAVLERNGAISVIRKEKNGS